MLFPNDLIPIETTHGMSVITAIILLGFGGTVYYTIRWLHNRTLELEKTSAKHNTNIATISQSERSIVKSLDVLRENNEKTAATMREDLKNAINRIEDRFAQIQDLIRDR